MHSQNPPHDVLVDVEAEGQSDLLGNSGTAPGRITSFHFKDGIDEFLCRSLRPRLTPALGRKQHAVLTFCQDLMEMEQSRGLQNYGGAQNACRTNKQDAQTGDDSVGNVQV